MAYNPATSAAAALKARVWVSRGTTYTFPEQQLLALPQTGVCFSGGGTRALAATMGQLRGLIAAQLMDRVGTISCVSGGSWAATAFTYYRAGARDDREFLGPVTAPAAITSATLEELSPHCLGTTATRDFKKALWDLLADRSVPRDEVWIRAVGQTFFADFGLYTPEDPAYFSLDGATVGDLVARNPALAKARFHTVRDHPGEVRRPFLVVNSTLIWPVDGLRCENRVGFEYTPLYVGSPYRLRIASKPLFRHPVYRTVGGGFLEPFAFGSPAPAAAPDPEGWVELTPPATPFTLTDASGSSSASFAALLDEVDSALSPHATYWPVSDATVIPAFSYAFGDGANLENYGLIALMLRKLKRIVVFLNDQTKLNLDYSPSADNPPSSHDLMSFVPELFGLPVREFVFFEKNWFPHNQVLRKDDFAVVVSKLQAAKRAGRAAIAVTTHTVEANDWWGVEGGWEVEICWVYLDRVAEWEAQLGDEIRDQIEQGNHCPCPRGAFEHFPNYKTVDENVPDLIRLSKPQVNLLADLTCWVVENSPELREFLGAGQGTG